MIIVQLLGGLGNQMFQYAFGRALAARLDLELRLDTSLLLDHSAGRHAVNRFFDLPMFTGDFQVATLQERIPFSCWGLPRLGRVLARTCGITSEARHTVEQASFGFDMVWFRNCAYFVGTWQSHKFFDAIERRIKSDFTLKPEFVLPSPLRRQIETTESVCINVRRGDYLTVSSAANSLGFVGLEYYREAIDQMQSAIPGCHFFVFSDDWDWCKQNFQLLANATFVDDRYNGINYSNKFSLMQTCKHFIIPNSTFAWWAAWLSDNNDKRVIAPFPWFNDTSLESNGLYPENWSQISASR